jgi:predicted TIM-barrel fold metal-dependent hydrolase
MDLSELPLVDHHAHRILLDRPTLDEFRGRFSESPDPRQWPHVVNAVTYRRAIRALASFFAVEPTEEAVYRHRLGSDPAEYAARLLGATRTETLLVDDGYPPPGTGTTVRELGDLAGCDARPVLRIERVAEEAAGDASRAVREAVTSARERGFAGLKTIAAYRGGLDVAALEAGPRASTAGGGVRGRIVAELLVAALEANEATGDPLPVQVHTGFGDSDIHLPLADPGYLKPLIEGFPETPFVLLHCYPFVREAGWLAHVYPNVFLDVSLTIPHVSRPAEALREALELAPLSKLLYASDAARTPELFYLASLWWRSALAEVLEEALPPGEWEQAARLVLRENARSLYRL